MPFGIAASPDHAILRLGRPPSILTPSIVNLQIVRSHQAPIYLA